MFDSARRISEQPDEGSSGDRRLRSLGLGSIERELRTLAAHINAGMCRWLELVGEFDRREGWASAGCRSCSEWISWRCGVASRAAREHVRVARRLTDLPRIRDAFASGKLSYSKVRALVRIAEPDTEDTLLDVAADATAAQLERIVAGMRRVTAAEANRLHEERYACWWWEDDGSLSLRARLAPEEGAQVLAALEAARDALRVDAAGDAPGGSAEPAAAEDESEQDPAEPGREEPSLPDDEPPAAADGDPESGSAEPRHPVEVECARVTNADALTAVAESFLATGPRSRKGGERYQLVVDVELDALMARGYPRARPTLGASSDPAPERRSAGGKPGHAPPPAGTTHKAPPEPAPPEPPSESVPPKSPPVPDPPEAAPAGHACVRDGPALSPEVARRLGCDASVVPIAHAGGETVSVGRKTRSIPPALRRALEARDHGCRFPGCERRRFVDAHHIVHWADGGRTDLDNLVTLCRHHHRLVHEGGFTVERRAGGRLVFRAPSGATLHEVPRPIAGDRARLRAAAGDPSNQWSDGDGQLWSGTGERVDLATVVNTLIDGLIYRRNHSS